MVGSAGMERFTAGAVGGFGGHPWMQQGRGQPLMQHGRLPKKSCYGVSSFLLRFDDGVSVGGELRRRVSAARQTGDGGNARGMRWRGRPPCFSVQMREVRRTMRKETDRTVTCAGIEGLRGDRRLSPAFQDGDLILFGERPNIHSDFYIFRVDKQHKEKPERTSLC